MTTEQLAHLIQDTPKSLIAERVKAARAAADLTLDVLGEKVGTSRHHLIRLEKGEHRPRVGMIEAIADATGKPVEWFVSSEGGTTPDPFRDAA